MKMSNFENPTWWTAAILKIIILHISQPQIVRISRDLVCRHKFYSRRRKRDKKSEIPKFKMADGRHIENHFLAINRLHRVRLRRNFEFGDIFARTRRLGDENVQFRKSNMADGLHFENNYIYIYQPHIVRIARNLVCRHKFYGRRRKRQKKIGNSQIQNGGWTSH